MASKAADTVNQAVHGKDFWQTDYDAGGGTWEISYTVAMDTPGDRRTARHFRFAMRR